MTDVNTYLDPAREKMELAVAYLDEALAHIRAGKANAKILDGIRVEYYGSLVPLSNVANISVPDARTIAITPWEKPMFKEIEKAIINSELGITPENNGEVIRLSIPPLTEERRRALVKQSKAEAEQAKVSVRNARRDAIEGLKKAVKQGMSEDVEKDGEAAVQKLHDKYLKQIDDVFAAKEKKSLQCRGHVPPTTPQRLRRKTNTAQTLCFYGASAPGSRVCGIITASKNRLSGWRRGRCGCSRVSTA